MQPTALNVQAATPDTISTLITHAQLAQTVDARIAPQIRLSVPHALMDTT